MNKLDILFDRMDVWRHFPNYQLERRADLFFSLYLPEALKVKCGFPIRADVAPEFPVRIGTIYPNIKTDKSYKIDYLALSEKGDKAIFVELKTEGRSIREEQDKYLKAAKEVGVTRLLEGLLEIFRATNSKRKYFCLLLHLESMGLLRIPNEMTEVMSRPALQGANEASLKIEIVGRVKESMIVYILPKGEGSNVISFHEFADIVQRHDDPISQRFAVSLRKWADVQAGEG